MLLVRKHNHVYIFSILACAASSKDKTSVLYLKWTIPKLLFPPSPAELPEKAETIRAVYKKIEELPPANYDTLERLIFHLVK